MAQTLVFPAPQDGDEVDGPFYMQGLRWSADADGSWIGVEWRVPDSLSVLQHYIAGFTVVGEALQASQAITPTPGAVAQFLFASPVAITADTVYCAAVLAQHYVYTAAYPFPQTDGHLTGLTCALGETVADTPAFPTNVTSLNFHVSPIVAFADEAAEGAGTAVLGGLAATGVGRRSRVGAGLSSLGALAATAAGTRSRAGVGVAALGGLVASGAGVRSRTGAGVANLGGLVATGTTLKSVGPRPPIVSQTNRHLIVSQTREVQL